MSFNSSVENTLEDMKKYINEGFSFTFMDDCVHVVDKRFNTIYSGNNLSHSFLAIEGHKDTIKYWEGDEASVQF